jgi:hypothetical protein
MSALSWELPGFDELREHGRERLRQGARRAIERHGAVAVELDDAALLDPRVHAFFYLQPPPCPLDQLLVGHVAAALRPACIEVVADASGVVHVPGAGVFPGCPPGARLELRWDGAWVLRDAVAHPLPPSRIAGTPIEFDEACDPGLARILTEDDASHELGGPAVAARHRVALERAVGWLSRLDDRYREELCRDCRVLRLFHCATRRSCANVSAYGAAFLQCEDDASAVFLVEDIAHQVGHVTFYGVTADPRRCFRVPPRVKVRELGGDEDDRRSLYDALHGNFTMGRMVGVFDAILSSRAIVLAPIERAELLGRFAQALRRFQAGLACIDDERLFTPEIWAIHRAWWRMHEQLWDRHRGALEGLDLGGQRYVFSWATYRARNGLV